MPKVELTAEESRGLSKSEKEELLAKKQAAAEEAKKLRHEAFDEMQQKAIEEYKDWSVAMMLGPLPYACFRVVAIAGIGLTLNIKTGAVCGQRLDVYLTLQLVLGYVFLLIYAWIFIPPFWPFKSIRGLTITYGLWALPAVGVNGWGIYMVATSRGCMATTPALYFMSLAEVVAHYFGLGICLIYYARLQYYRQNKEAIEMAEEMRREEEEYAAEMAAEEAAEAKAAEEAEAQAVAEAKEAEEEAKRIAKEEAVEQAKKDAVKSEQAKLDELYGSDSDDE